MRPKQLSKFLAAAIQQRLPILITGAPGTGKTAICEQAAIASDANFIVTHPVVEDPTSAMGLPWPDPKNGHANFLPFGQLAKLLRADKATLWLMDDLGQASPAVQAANMQWILARQCGEHKLPDCVTIVACSNRRTDRAGVSGMLEPVKSRFASIVELEPNLDDWCDWAFDTKQPLPLIAFMRFRPALLHAFNPTQDLKNSPCPRTWSYAGRFIDMGLDRDVELAAIQGAVGESAAAEFVGFLRVWREMPSLDGILLDPDHAKIPKDGAARYAVAVGLAEKATPANFGRMAVYIQRLYDEAHGDFAALLFKDAYRRCPEISDTSSFIKLSSTEVGRLVRG